ncbi:MAG: (2Fe-2S)-binding protein [Alphaproteobacteria bacterium]|nr:MAG: (2Fe-2S)-binding protein [Alphaproteobacteria bacterium]
MDHDIRLRLNGKTVTLAVAANRTLASVLRDELGLTGTHIGCDTCQCGACTVHLDGRAVKACAVLAVQADGHAVTTIEGLAKGETLHPMQAAFQAHHALQCGFCTPGMIMQAIDIAQRHAAPDAATIRAELDGNLCRCTGYHNIVKAIAAGARAMRG